MWADLPKNCRVKSRSRMDIIDLVVFTIDSEFIYGSVRWNLSIVLPGTDSCGMSSTIYNIMMILERHPPACISHARAQTSSPLLHCACRGPITIFCIWNGSAPSRSMIYLLQHAAEFPALNNIMRSTRYHLTFLHKNTRIELRHRGVWIFVTRSTSRTPAKYKFQSVLQFSTLRNPVSSSLPCAFPLADHSLLTFRVLSRPIPESRPTSSSTLLGQCCQPRVLRT
ncbi:hypothetical protein EDB19DRAFT_818316 [Suillus lakei]|nr:hypothetical protein EDB19DRAFT_818316 [Suillus lakei]